MADAFHSRAVKDLQYLAIAELKRSFISSVKACGTAVDGQLRTMAHAFDSRNDSAEFRQIHQRVGDLAQQSVLRSYDQLVTARERPASKTHYRAGQNRLPLTLRKALGRKDFFEATPQGIRWGNVTMLDTQARHWYRINFGARPAGTGSHARFQVRFNNLVLASLGYDEPPSPPFFLPPGFWLGPEGREGRNVKRLGQDQFYPGAPLGHGGLKGQRFGRRQRVRRTLGIKEKNFLDAGLRTIATEFPKGYAQHYERIAHKFFTGQRRIAVRPTGPRPIQFRVGRS